ncbi:hypothetical protein [Sporosarcina sp. BP05]|uniref:hypothetical protein n=1 Tax=Sporosarcina sp. BP05 TaxID=2758726 RepID=UPI00164920C9|nr:hypothetical protein [Sporosarcina sp. BP05]
MNLKSVIEHSSFLIKKSARRKVETILFVLLLGLLVTGCSQTEPEDKNIVAIQTVLEHEFNAPDKEYIRMKNDPSNMTIVDQNGLVSAPEKDNEINIYLEDKFMPYFTDFGYSGKVLFLTLHSPADNNGYQIAVDEIDVEPVEGRPRDYDFTVHVTYQKDGGDKTKTEITGLATCPEEGKIGNIRYNKDYFLFVEMLRGK